MSNSCGLTSSVVIGGTISGGWATVGGVAYDTMSIHETQLQYHTNCRSSNKVNTHTISCDEWNLLLNSVDIKEFNKLNIHTCNACVDGVDYSISIKTDTSYNKITFGKEYGENSPIIKDLFAEIEKLRANYTNEICDK